MIRFSMNLARCFAPVNDDAYTHNEKESMATAMNLCLLEYRLHEGGIAALIFSLLASLEDLNLLGMPLSLDTV